jgi:hypothetical protein
MQRWWFMPIIISAHCWGHCEEVNRFCVIDRGSEGVVWKSWECQKVGWWEWIGGSWGVCLWGGGMQCKWEKWVWRWWR